jgi:hypothetical protein
MRALIVSVLIALLAGDAAAQDLGTRAPAKTPQSYPANVPAPERQGGDTIATATLIPMIPYSDTGTTAGYTDDYNEVCPYMGAGAPDVVYRYDANTSNYVEIDLCGSSYDTKLYVYDDALTLIACNDDYYTDPGCGEYVSNLESVLFVAGATYYIVVDGYGSASGDYVLALTELYVDPFYCPSGSVDEGEPPLVDDHVDDYNGGCGAPGTPFQNIAGDANGEFVLCGVSGWYENDGSTFRDTDWFILTAGPAGTIEVAADAGSPTLVFELGPQDCATVSVLQQITVGPISEGTMTISGYPPGGTVWLWVGPTVFAAPGPEEEYLYGVWLSGLDPAVATEATTWSTVKALYN